MINKSTLKIISNSIVCVMLTTSITCVNVKAAEIRYQGKDRIDTAIKISQSGWKDKSDYAIIAAADDNFLIDSLVASPLAKAYDAPIFLNYKGDTLDLNIMSEIKRLGVSKVFIVSSESALGKGIENKLTTSGVSVERLGKKSSSETSIGIANAIKSKYGSVDKVCLVSEDASHIADALSIAPIAGMNNIPILLAKQNSLSDEVKNYIKDNNLKSVYVIGGQSVISDEIVKQTGAVRICGSDRYKTNVAVLDYFKDNFKNDKVFISSGSDAHMIDALAGSVLAAKNASPIILVGDTLSEDTKKYLRTNLNEESQIGVFGGIGAVSSNVERVVDSIKNGEEDGLYGVAAADSVGTKAIKIILKHSMSFVDKTNFSVSDENNKISDIRTVELAPWDNEHKTVMVTLSSALEAGKLYSVNSVKFVGNGDNLSPSILSINSTDYNKVEITFTKPINITKLKAKICESYDSKVELSVKSISYADNTPNKIELVTENQKGSTLYKVELSGGTDYEGALIEDGNISTFIGTAIDLTTKLSVVSAKAVDSKNIMVTFNTKINNDEITNISNYNVKEAFGNFENISISNARAAVVEDEGITDSINTKCNVLVTLSKPMKDSTLYNISVSGLKTSTGVGIDDAYRSSTFIGMGPYTTPMDMSDEGNIINAYGSKKLRVTFKRHISKEKLIKQNFSILNIENNFQCEIASLNIVDDRNVDIEISGMTNALYKLTVYNITDVDGNTFADGKNSKIYQGIEHGKRISSVISTELLEDNVSLLITFDSEVASSAKDVSHYKIDNGIGYPSKAEVLDAKRNTVKLTIPKTIKGRAYKVSISGLENLDGDMMTDESISCSFIGKGLDGQNPKIDTAVGIDKQTIEIYFDRSVKDPSIDGSGRVWNSSTNTLERGSLILLGKYNKALDTYSNVYVHEDLENDNALIVRVGSGEFVSKNAASDGTFQISTKLSSSSYAKVFFSPIEIEPESIRIKDVKAINKNTIRVSFDQAVEFESGADFAKITSDADKAQMLQNASRYNSVSGSLKLTKPTPTDTSYRIYDFAVVGGNLPGNCYLVVNPSIRNSTYGGVHDYTKNQKIGFVTLADEDSSISNIQQMREFAGSTSETGVINNIPVMMKDSKTIEVYYAEVMSTMPELGKTSVLDKKNYKLVDRDNNEIASNFLLVHICDISYELNGNRATLVLNSPLPISNKGYYLQFNNTMQNALGTKYVKESINDNTQLKSQFVQSSKEAQKLMISNTTKYAPDTRTLTIKLSQKSASVVSYDRTVFLADFKITLTDSDGNSYTVQDSDILSLSTKINDSIANADDTIQVVFRDKINSTKTIKKGSVGKIEMLTNSTLRGINGEGSQNAAYMVFAQ